MFEHLYSHIHTHTHARTPHTHVHAHTRAHTHTHTHTHTRTHTHTHTVLCTHTHTPGLAVKLDSPTFAHLHASTGEILGESKPYSITGSLPLVVDLQEAAWL